MISSAKEPALISSAKESAGRAPLREDVTLAGWESVSVVSSVLIAEWAVSSLSGGSRIIGAIPATLAVAYVIFSQRLRGESAREVGWRLDNFPRAARMLVLPTIIPAVLLVAIGWYASSINLMRWGGGGRGFFGVLPFGVAWGLLQQFVLQGFVNRRAQLIWGAGWTSIFFVALVFALLHLPNPWLTLATLVGGLMWAFVYQRAPNILALGLSHALMTWLLISTIPPAALHSLRVGFNYFR